MNADAYLRKQGWKGSGHSLDSTGRGIKKPLLIAHKQDQLGLGKRKAAHATDDQWWMRAFDQSLQNIGTGEESTLSQIRTQGINRGGLYGFFVKGEAIVGTIDDSSTANSFPPSGTSTPPTSAPETDLDIEATKTMAVEASKRKRSEPEASSTSKKAKTIAATADDDNMQEATAEADHADAVAAKIAKLTPEERADYESRAAAKNQTLSQYVLRRIQKKAEKKADKHAAASTSALVEAPESAEPTNPPLFFADLDGDANIVKSVSWTPLPNGKCPPDPTIWEGRDINSLPKKVRRAKREYVRQQRLEKRFITKMTEEQQEKLIDMAYAKLRIDPDKATEEQLVKVRDEAKTLMRQGKLIERKRKNAEKKEKNAEPKVTVNIDYAPLPDGSCPLDPTLWEGHKPKVLPKPVREARFRWIVEQRLAKKMKEVEGNQRKSLTNLTKAEKQLLRKKAAGDVQTSVPIDEEKFDKRQWSAEELRERHLRKVERKRARKEQMRKDRQLKKEAKKEKKGKRSETRGAKKYKVQNPARHAAPATAVAA